MKKRNINRFFIILLLSTLILGACDLNPADSAIPSASPIRVNLSGAQSLFLQPDQSRKSVIAPDGAVLMKILGDASVGEAIFENDLGESINVTITRTLQLSSEYLLIDFIYAEGNIVAIVEIANGTLHALDPAPSDWKWIRFYNGNAYYVASSSLRRLNLSTLTSTVMSGADAINSTSVLYVVPPGNVFCFYLINGMIDIRNQLAIYYANGSPKTNLSGSPEAYRLYERAQSGMAVEDQATGAVYYIRSKDGDLIAERVRFGVSGVNADAPVVLDAGWPNAYHIASKTGIAYVSDSVWGYDSNLARIVLDASGNINIVDTYAASKGYFNDNAVYRGGDVYYADSVQATKGVRRYQLGVTLTETQIITDEITDFEPVGEYVFYCGVDNKTYRYDLGTGLTELYASTPIDIRAVTE